jgi:hypothetical protein
MILTKISAYDRRTIGDADAEAWAEALEGRVTVQDALTAVRDHFRESTSWIMPADVIRLGKLARMERVRSAGVPDLPADLSPADERRWLQAYWAVFHRYGPEDGPGHAFVAANRELGITADTVSAHVLPPEEVKARIAAFGASLKSIPGPQGHQRTEQQ